MKPNVRSALARAVQVVLAVLAIAWLLHQWQHPFVALSLMSGGLFCG
ncbi:hypothetical protein G5B35_06360 [Parapusillimonas sp. SGNA-6]|nr:hypothetical protein [Parapusillimonas sp. SGNA-6]